MEKVEEARELFDIEKFPSNFFELKPFSIYLKNHKIIIFKEAIGNLSGFIGYGSDDFTVICINYCRPIGHQNFTFAHELGHWMLHKGIAYSDDDKQIIYSKEFVEKEANRFAQELLYPKECVTNDYHFILENDLFSKRNRMKLAEFIDGLCHKYCMSYDAVLSNILFKANKWKEKNKLKKEIKTVLGMNWSDYFEKDFYTVNYDLPQYQKSEDPYNYMDSMINHLLSKEEISKATAESIKLRNGLEIEL